MNCRVVGMLCRSIMKSHPLFIFCIFVNVFLTGCMNEGRVDILPAIDYMPSNHSQVDSANLGSVQLSDLKDKSILNKERVVFYEDFESANYYKKWSKYDGRPIGVGTVSSPLEYVFSGKRSAVVINREGLHEAEGDGKFVPRDPIDKVAFVRLYLRLSDHFSLGSANGIKLFSIVGTRHHTYYKGAGHRPNGHDRYGATLVMDKWNELFIYCYHPEQRSGYGDEFYKTGIKSRPKL